MALDNLFENIDSSIELYDEIVLFSISGSWTHVLAYGIPVYLVSPETMDAISPQERRIGIPLEYREEINSIIEESFRSLNLYEIDEVFDRINRFSKSYPVMGLFIASTGTSRTIEVAGRDIKLPAIILCPERILDEAEKVSRELGLGRDETLRSLTRIVLVHEQSHVISWKLSRGKTYLRYGGIHYRVVEETLAQTAAYFNSPMRPNNAVYESVLLASSKHQPMEYNIWRIITPLMEGAPDAYTVLHAYSVLVSSGQADPIALLMPPLWYKRSLPPISYSLRMLHSYYVRLGPLAHEFFHNFIEPLIAKSRKTDDLVKVYALALLYSYTRITEQ